MKGLLRPSNWIACLLVFSLAFFGWTQATLAGASNSPLDAVLMAVQRSPRIENARICSGDGPKIDLNNANAIAFTDCPGFYPNLARSILANGPYNDVKDILDIPGLSDRQKQLLSANLDNFTVTDPVIPLEMRMPPRPAIGKFAH